MAKRIIQQCDLCKGEYDPDDTHLITVKKKGKQKGNVFDLCPECAAKIQRQLVAASSEMLDVNWTFDGLSKLPPGMVISPADLQAIADEITIAPRGSARAAQEADIAAAQQADDDLITRKEGERRTAMAEAGQPLEEEQEASEVPYETVAPAPLEDGGCGHMNKGRIYTVNKQFVQDCRDCGETLVPNTASDRAAYMGTRAGRGTTLSSHESDRRQRD